MIIDILLPISLIFIMFSLGVGLTKDDFVRVLKMPNSFFIGLLNQMFILPVIAFFIVSFFNLERELAVGFMILSCCPGGVTSNILTKIAKGDIALSISLTAIASIITVLTLPIIVSFSILFFMGTDAPDIKILPLCLTMFFLTTIPVTIGVYVNSKFHSFVVKFSKISNNLSTFLFIIIVLGALSSEWNAFVNNLIILGPSIILLIIIMFVVGYISSKVLKINKNRAITIAIESSIQNATVGITIGALISNSNSGLSLYSLASGVYGILMYIVCIPLIYIYVKIIK